MAQMIDQWEVLRYSKTIDICMTEDTRILIRNQPMAQGCVQRSAGASAIWYYAVRQRQREPLRLILRDGRLVSVQCKPLYPVESEIEACGPKGVPDSFICYARN